MDIGFLSLRTPPAAVVFFCDHFSFPTYLRSRNIHTCRVPSDSTLFRELNFPCFPPDADVFRPTALRTLQTIKSPP